MKEPSDGLMCLHPLKLIMLDLIDIVISFETSLDIKMLVEILSKVSYEINSIYKLEYLLCILGIILRSNNQSYQND